MEEERRWRLGIKGALGGVVMVIMEVMVMVKYTGLRDQGNGASLL